mmetsp:Transcript_26218/g.83260  ORF Transcript_26218/g.83260 Transcript_26218/m.83260 type:complete len:339 (-) Transcript_26218:158-1174(-)
MRRDETMRCDARRGETWNETDAVADSDDAPAVAVAAQRARRRLVPRERAHLLLAHLLLEFLRGLAHHLWPLAVAALRLRRQGHLPARLHLHLLLLHLHLRLLLLLRLLVPLLRSGHHHHARLDGTVPKAVVVVRNATVAPLDRLGRAHGALSSLLGRKNIVVLRLNGPTPATERDKGSGDHKRAAKAAENRNNQLLEVVVFDDAGIHVLFAGPVLQEWHIVADHDGEHVRVGAHVVARVAAERDLVVLQRRDGRGGELLRAGKLDLSIKEHLAGELVAGHLHLVPRGVLERVDGALAPDVLRVEGELDEGHRVDVEQLEAGKVAAIEHREALREVLDS